MKSVVTLMQRINDDRDIPSARDIARSFHGSCTKSRNRVRNLDARTITTTTTRPVARAFTCLRLSARRSEPHESRRRRFAGSIIVRFFSRLSAGAQEQEEEEELAGGSRARAKTRRRDASPDCRGRYSRKSHAVLRICNARTLRYCVPASPARVARSVLRRFFPTCYSRAGR